MAQSHKNVPTSDAATNRVPRVPTCHLTKYKLKGFYNPIFRFKTLLEWLMELRKTLYSYLLTFAGVFITCNSVYNSGAQSCHAFFGYTILSSPWCVQKLPKPHCFRIFMEVSVCRHEWLSHWPLVIELSLQPLSPPWRLVEGVAESSNPLILAWSFWPPSWSYLGGQFGVISLHAKETLITQEIPEVWEALCHKPGTEIKYVHPITPQA